MNTNHLLKMTLVLAATAAGATHAVAQEPCPNCSAEVVIASDQAQDFADALMILNSMPLSGDIIQIDPAHESTVRVATSPDYAQLNGIDSFDVAKKIMGFVGAKYRITEIRAIFKPDPQSGSMSNVGTIGHTVGRRIAGSPF